MRGGLRPGIRQALVGACLLVLLSGSAQAYTTILNRDAFQWEGDRVKEPESDFSPEDTSAQALSGTFLQEYPVARDSAWLMPGEDSQAQVVRITAKEAGPCVYVIAGVHGNERAAWMAGILLRDISIRKGCLHVLAPANTRGARAGTRNVTGREDLNRSFPGDAQGKEAHRLAAAIWEDIQAARPELILDLHEAITYREEVDFLGNTLVFTRASGMEELLLDLSLHTHEPSLFSAPFTMSGPGPEGSINHSATLLLGVPTLTVETFRGFPLETRIKDQLRIVEYILRYLGMLE